MNQLNKYKKEMIAFVTGKNGVRLLVGLFLVILAALFLLSSQRTASKTEPAEKDETESKLSAILSQIQGAGEVRVMITYASSGEKVPAKNENSNKSETSDSSGGRITSNENSTSSPVTISESGGSSPLILKELAPAVQGVVVIARGGDDFYVKTQLIRAVMTALDVPAESVDVFTMKQSKGEK